MLGGIALQYGLTVEDLLAANPDVDPGFLKIGSTLVVPLEVSELIVEATSAPMPIQAGAPDCYPTSDGGAFCLMMATNQGEESAENIFAKISLLSQDGESVAEVIALLPLNVLHEGESLPVLAFFPSPLEPDMNVHGEVISALPLLDENTRYLNAEVELEEVIFEPDGIQARVQGHVGIPAGSRPPDYVWLAAVAYRDSGEVIGVRKWVAPGEQSCPDLEMGDQTVDSEGVLECLSFDFTVFSLGPQIDRVEVYAEAGYQAQPEGTP